MAEVSLGRSGRLPLRGMLVRGDDELARRAAEGDRGAFAAIYRRHHQAIYRYCRSILGNDADARDALQSAMTKALAALDGERRRIALRPWLFRIAHNESISIARSRRHEAPLDAVPEAGDEGAEQTRGDIQALLSDLGTLPDRQRGALLMRELSGLGYAEIAAALDSSPAGAKQAVYEGRIALRDLEEGREMQCDVARRTISDRDGRALRSRRLRAHLRSCADCSTFRDSIGARHGQLAALAPALPAAASIEILRGLLGGGGDGGLGGGLVGLLGTGKAAIAPGAAKVAAVVATGAVVAGGGAGVVAVTKASSGSDSGASGNATSVAGSGSLGGGAGILGTVSGEEVGGFGAIAATVRTALGGRADGPGLGALGAGGGKGAIAGESLPEWAGGGESGDGHGSSGSATGGGSGSGPIGSTGGGSNPTGSGSNPTGSEGGGPAGTPPGHGGTPPGQGGTPPGLGGPPPGHGGTPPGLGGGTPPGQGGSPPGLGGGTPPSPPGLGGGTPPGQGGSPPGLGGGGKPPK